MIHQMTRSVAAVAAALALAVCAVGLWNVAGEQRTQNELTAEANCREAVGLNRTDIQATAELNRDGLTDRYGMANPPVTAEPGELSPGELSDLLSLCLPGGTCPADPSDEFVVWAELLQPHRCEATP
ncbi:MAG: hypothetical protein ACI8TP_004724 [Acidimicrobiales bacterium]|jgi:hypothetical protein